MSTPQHINVQYPLQRILRVTAQAWGVAPPARACGPRQEASVHRRLVCRSQAPYFSIAY